MTDCAKCKHKKDRCYCPPGRECKAFEREVYNVKYAFEFNANDDWDPGGIACWTNCPFSILINPGDVCNCIKRKALCPFLQGSYSFARIDEQF